MIASPLHGFIALCTQMKQQGIRRLLIITGDEYWCQQQAQQLTELLIGDWLWVSDTRQSPNYCHPRACKTLQGREIHHAIMDVRYCFDVQALAILAGSLTAGSLLVLLTPPWQQWEQQPDLDSMRWNDGQPSCPTPNFIRYLQQCLQQDSDVIVLESAQPVRLPVSHFRPDWHPTSEKLFLQQHNLLQRLRHMPCGTMVVSAARGRGKSALAGMFIASWPGNIIVTAPARIATDVIAAHAGASFRFIAPDTLLASPPPAADWLIIDEAATLPAAQLKRLIALYPRNLLTTTVQGYEGTGRGFLLKFCASVPGLRHYQLSQPIRWADGDPLERIINQVLLLEDEPQTGLPAFRCSVFREISQQQWQYNSSGMAQIYRLLSTAHYRTSPLDLRRMMDAPGQHFITASSGEYLIGALWLVQEGGLSKETSRAIWAGTRRPPGNLVAQSLAAHGVCPLAACLTGWRISRIVVHPDCQRRGNGQQLIRYAITRAREAGYDYLSVSFGYTPCLWRFWQQAGFQMVRFGTQREASSGCYTAMALYPLSLQGQKLADAQTQQLQRDIHWLQPVIDESLPLSGSVDQRLCRTDWLNLAGFAFAKRPAQTSLASLHRLSLASHLPLILLRQWLQLSGHSATLCQQFHFTGQKALIAQLRQQTADALQALDSVRCQQLRRKIPGWQTIPVSVHKL